MTWLNDWFRLLTAFPRLWFAAWCIRMACRLVRIGRSRGVHTLVAMGVSRQTANDARHTRAKRLAAGE